MRTFVPAMPPKDPTKCHPEVYRILKQFSDWAVQADAAFAKVSRQQTPDQRQETPPTPPNIDDHGNLLGLVPTLNPDGTVSDYNDDHTQYPLIFGRPGGQSLYGSRAATAGAAWLSAGTAIASASTTGGASFAHSVSSTIVVNNGIVLVASSGVNPETQGSGETNYHTSVTDTGGNTWTKLKEFTVITSPAGSAKIVSLWFCLVTTALTVGVSTVTVNYSTAMDRHAAEAYQYTLSAGATVVVAAYTTDGTVSGGEVQPSLSLSGLSGESLFVRAMAIQPSSGGSGTVYNQSTNFLEFVDDHTNSTTSGAFSFSARGEFRVLSASGTTSSPTLAPSDFYTTAAIFAALQVSSSSGGDLLLGSANTSNSGKIRLLGANLNFIAGTTGSFIFDPLGSGGFTGTLNFDSISGSSKTYTFPNTTGTIALTSDLTAYLKLDASNDPLTGTLDTQVLRPSADNTYDLGDSTHSYKDLYLSSDIIPKTDAVMDIGTVALGIKQEHYAYPTVGSGTIRALAKGMLWEDNSLGDVFVGADNVFGYLGFYSQRVTKANSSVVDLSEDASNIFQGAWGSGANPSYPFVEINYQVGNGTGRYTSLALGEDTSLVRDGAQTIGVYDSSLTRGGGGLAIMSRQANSGVYQYFDETNHWFLIRTLSAGGMASQVISGVAFAGTRLTAVLPSTDNTVNLGVATTNRWKDIYYHGTLTSTVAGTAISFANSSNIVFGTSSGTKIGTGTTQLIGFYNATPVGQQGATTDLGTALSNLGLRAAGTAYPITTSGAVSFTGTIGLGGQVTISDAINFALNTTTGTKIGTGITEKLGFWNAAPIAQPTTAIAAATFVTNTSLIANDTATFDGYTIGQICKALRNAGILA